MKLNFREWVHKGLPKNAKYHFFTKSNLFFENQQIISSRLQKSMDESMASLFNIEFDHRIHQYAEKIANMHTDQEHFEKHGATSDEPFSTLEKFLKIHKKDKGFISILPIKNQSGIVIPDEKKLRNECRKYIEKYNDLDKIYEDEKNINYFSLLKNADYTICRMKPYKQFAPDFSGELSDIALEFMNTESKPHKDRVKTTYMNFKFEKSPGNKAGINTKLFNAFNTGFFDVVMSRTIHERNQDESFDKRSLENLWEKKFETQLQYVATEMRRKQKEAGLQPVFDDINFIHGSNNKSWQVDQKNIDDMITNNSQTSKKLPDADSSPVKSVEKNQIQVSQDISNKVKNILDNINNRPDISTETKHMLNPSKKFGQVSKNSIEQAVSNLHNQDGNFSSHIIKYLKPNLDAAGLNISRPYQSKIVKAAEEILLAVSKDLSETHQKAIKFALIRTRQKLARGQLEI